ncbi:MAG TPA: histidinol dehydrogenase [Chryseosolibacter sp.]|nr:histidinol dehydrogenase [Chryseosolibacter sp.]
MKIFDNPARNAWKDLTERPQLGLDFLESAVRNILNRVQKSGDTALRELTLQFDKVAVDTLEVSASEIARATTSLSAELKESIRQAAENITKFHAAQKRETVKIETTPGVTCWRRGVPITRVGIYIPGGSAPLFSTVLMLGIPAKLAGCDEIILCTPPDKSGNINPAVLFTANLVGISRVFRIGGAQAIAAMAYGTQTVPKVHKIFGPGNQYVTKAKQMVTEDRVAIDLPAGPSEVLLVADRSSNPVFIAADLLSQAEHGDDSQVMLVMLDKTPVEAITSELQRQLDSLPRKTIAQKALANSRMILFNDTATAIDFINDYAPEHLIVNVNAPEGFVERITNAGSVFIGNYSPEAVGDYASGTNHTLPTNGYAKAYAGVSLDSFLKYITYQQVSEIGIANIGPAVERMAEAEELIGHKRAISVRLEALKK